MQENNTKVRPGIRYIFLKHFKRNLKVGRDIGWCKEYEKNKLMRWLFPSK